MSNRPHSDPDALLNATFSAVDERVRRRARRYPFLETLSHEETWPQLSITRANVPGWTSGRAKRFCRVAPIVLKNERDKAFGDWRDLTIFCAHWDLPNYRIAALGQLKDAQRFVVYAQCSENGESWTLHQAKPEDINPSNYHFIVRSRAHDRCTLKEHSPILN